MKKFLLIGLICLAGCHTVYQDRVVPVPMPMYDPPPEPASVPVPELPLSKITSETSKKEVVRLVWATVEVLEDYAEKLQESVKPFKKEENGS